MKVTVLGAAGGIGQPLSLLIKQLPSVSRLSLYDIVNTVGIATDISHISTPAKVSGHAGGEAGLSEALEGADIVVIPAGIPRKPGMTRDDLFKINAGIVRDLAAAAAKICPKAFICVISNPVNSTVPIVAEVFKQAGVYDPKRLFGVTTLDVVRASTFVHQVRESISPLELFVPVIGGHSGATIIPLLSQAVPAIKPALNQSEIEALTNRIQYGGDEVVKAKDGAGSATLSMAHAGARFVASLIKGVTGHGSVKEPAYVSFEADPSSAIKAMSKDSEFFASLVEFGSGGVAKIISPAKPSEYEEKLLQVAIPEIHASIKKGVEFVSNNPKL